MANFNEQVLQAWDEWEDVTGQEAGNPDEFVIWAMNNKKLVPQPQDIRKLLRKQVTSALRQKLRIDEIGTTYRAKQCVISNEHGVLVPLWFDVDTGEIEEDVDGKAGVRKGGIKGGKSRAKKLTAQERSEIARIAAQARWKKG